MSRLIDEIKYDLGFIKSHSLQPQWYKVLKVFVVLGFLVSYCLVFGWIKTAIFSAVFFFLATVVHLVYRTKTKKFTHSWLDFQVAEEGKEKTAERIGVYYYVAVAINLILALVVSQMLI
jgi:Ca2+-dependent lipid-binding protein